MSVSRAKTAFPCAEQFGEIRAGRAGNEAGEAQRGPQLTQGHPALRSSPGEMRMLSGGSLPFPFFSIPATEKLVALPVGEGGGQDLSPPFSLVTLKV